MFSAVLPQDKYSFITVHYVSYLLSYQNTVHLYCALISLLLDHVTTMCTVYLAVFWLHRILPMYCFPSWLFSYQLVVGVPHVLYTSLLPTTHHQTYMYTFSWSKKKYSWLRICTFALKNVSNVPYCIFLNYTNFQFHVLSVASAKFSSLHLTWAPAPNQRTLLRYLVQILLYLCLSSIKLKISVRLPWFIF